MPSPQTAGKKSTALPCPPPVVQVSGSVAGTSQASTSFAPVSARVLNWPFTGLTIGVVASTVMNARFVKPPAPIGTPAPVMVIATVLFVGSPASSAQPTTPALSAVQLMKESVPGSSVVQADVVHASFTRVVPVSVAGTLSSFGGLVFVLVLVNRTVMLICWLITSDESVGKIDREPLA
jgi:hypothetical protein